MNINRWDFKQDGALSEDSLQRKIESQGFDVTTYIYPPGTFFPDHSHSIDKIDAVLSGQFKMMLQGQSEILEAGDCLFVPKDVIHSAQVVGDEPVISLDGTRQQK